MHFTGPGEQTVQLGSAFPFDPAHVPHWGETCPPGYVGVPPYCALTTPGGVPTYPGGPGSPPQPATAPNGAAPVPMPGTGPAAACMGRGGRWDAATNTCKEPPATAAPTASWWGSLSTVEKVALVSAAALGGYALVRMVSRSPGPAGSVYRPNLAPDVKRTARGVPLIRGRRWGRASPPSKYRRLGATKASQYAYPARFMYPIHNRKYVAAAKTRFTQHKADYPPSVRRVIAKNINRAARRVGLSPDVKP